jgi:hypothetical protein
MAGYWRGSGGHDQPTEPDRPERLESQADQGRRIGEIDESKISDKELLSFFGYKDWDEWARDHADDAPALDEYEPPARGVLEDEKAGQSADTDQQSEQTRLWQTIAEETGDVRSYPNYAAMKKDLGSEPGKHLHHLVEQSQVDPKRSGFPVERVNSTDNVTRIPAETHHQVTAHFNRKPLGADRIRRDQMDGKPWDYQHEYGASVLDSIMDKQQRSKDDEPRS